MVLRYAAGAGNPPWNTRLISQTALHGLSLSAAEINAVGGALPPAYGASDNVGDPEPKSLLAQLTLEGDFSAASSENFFTYRGYETYYDSLTVQEAGQNVVYAIGNGEEIGFGGGRTILAKYDAQENPLWKRKYATKPEGGSAAGTFERINSHGYAMAWLNNHLYLVGLDQDDRRPDATNGARPMLLKYDAAAQSPDPNVNLDGAAILSPVWSRIGTSEGSFHDVTTMDGFLYAAGSSFTRNVAQSNEFLIEKYDEAGNRLWRMNTGGASDDILTSIVGVNGRLFASGYTRSEGAGEEDVIVLEINPATGAEISRQVYGGGQADRVWGMAAEGNFLYVVGESRSFAQGGNSVGQNDVLLLQYDIGAAVEPAVSVAVGPASVVENGAANLVYTFTRTGDTTVPLTVNFTVGGNAAFDDDYSQTGAATFTSTSGTVSFAAGSSTTVVTLDPAADAAVEPDETAVLTVTAGPGYTVGAPSAATGTITNDDVQGPFQIVSGANASVSAPAGQSLQVTARYNTSDNDSTLPGLGLRLHFDSSKLAFSNLSNVLPKDLVQQQAPQPDAGNFDGDTNTDQYVLVSWSDFSAPQEWPGQPLPVDLYAANFSLAAGLPVGASTFLRFSASSTAPTHTFDSSPIEVIVAPPFSLDVDDNGVTDALTDGTLILRYLFGFTGASLVSGAVGLNPPAQRTDPNAIVDFLNGGRTTMLDPDNNGQADALTDGTLILRYLFGFTGDSLVSGALGLNPPAQRTDPNAIAAFLGGYEPSLPSSLSVPDASPTLLPKPEQGAVSNEAPAAAQLATEPETLPDDVIYGADADDSLPPQVAMNSRDTSAEAPWESATGDGGDDAGMESFSATVNASEGVSPAWAMLAGKPQAAEEEATIPSRPAPAAALATVAVVGEWTSRRHDHVVAVDCVFEDFSVMLTEEELEADSLFALHQ
jgi:hypothetical protein